MNTPSTKSKFAARISPLQPRRLSAFQKDASAELIAGQTIIEVDPTRVRFKKQIRKADNPGLSEESLRELGKSMKRDGQHTPAVLQPDNEKGDGWYIMVAGERRCRGAILENLKLRAVVRDDLTEEQFRRIQRSENIDRENLTQLEVAAQLREDKDRLGTLEAVAEEWQRSVAWVSERLLFLTAAESGGPVAEVLRAGASSDIAALNDLHRLNKVDPEKADAVAKQLQESGEGSSRAIVRDALRASKQKAAPSQDARKPSGQKPAGEPHTKTSGADQSSRENSENAAALPSEAPSLGLRDWLEALDVSQELRAYMHPTQHHWVIAANAPAGAEYGQGFVSLDALVRELSACDQAGKVIIDMGTVLAAASPAGAMAGAST